MNNDWLDIGVLEDYLDGKLDAKAMNRVEREALEDPFVAEALAGLSASPKRSLASISLLQKQLKERVAEHHVAKKTKVITWQRLSIAATAAVLFIGVSIIFWMKEVAQQNQLAKQGKEVEVNIKPEGSSVEIPSADAVSASTTKEALVKNKNNDPSVAASAFAGSSVAGQRKKEIVDKAFQKAKTNSYAANTKKKATANLNEVAIPVAEQTETAAIVMAATQSAYASPMAKSARMRAVPALLLAGKVVSELDGKPVAGAAVKIVQGTAGNVTMTDANGEFKIPADSIMKDYTLAVSHPGFAPNRLVARLNEPIGVTLKKDLMIGAAFIPVGGWDKYNQYLEQNNRLTKAHTLGATVQVSFLIGKDGKPYDFKILRTPGAKYDKEAIRLISEGPKWEQPFNPEGRVQLGVKF
ncbi:carboxypeptidase regulatory-like domain-containing protein [Pedobacter gandavensis]|uniref:TonB C-terminal domain-containing protein n=1 Tax=Pedobacter gandavensis TaxID=2679963 RepID=A0ABR6F0J8_9SPHI|nr:carboxypeptidase regulatory-like domain-containing protein [Pedobacter gandavensis]MBB2151024.1 hypothetical protein [Pedobacter gandavensis]